jgi:hypothetical protein
MAIVKLKDVAVTRLNQSGFGVKVTESNENNGKTYKTQFTLWFKEASGLSEGDVISVSGFLSAKVGAPWTDREGQERTSVELSINSPKLDGDAQGSHVPVQEQEAPAVSGWDAAPDESPF